MRGNNGASHARGGWRVYTERRSGSGGAVLPGGRFESRMTRVLAFFNPATHDTGEKIVLGQKIPAGGVFGDGEMVLNILARHPSTARFIATKLARRFISDDPPQAVVDRAAAVFLKTDGSITDTLRAILMSPEFVSRGTYRAKTRSPFEYVAAALRALNAETERGST